MISLTNVRLINWYAFANVTAPVGNFTLIAGKNGNGKSVLLDAIKYAAFGDTVFNKSSESKGSRTLSSYTRGLLDATAGTYIRPADRVPTVYTHIVLEYYDSLEDKYFILGAVIETNAANNCQTLRYALDQSRLSEISHTYETDGVLRPYSASELQRTYRLQLLNREQGLQKFLQMTGLKINLEQLPTYLRKLRGIMSYDPDAKVDRFIRESVLEEKNIDFTKLIEAKENIARLNDTFRLIGEEVEELDGILAAYDKLESEQGRLLADDIKRVYQKKTDLEQSIAGYTQEKKLAERQQEENAVQLRILEQRADDIDTRLVKAQVNLRSLDCMQMIEEEERRMTALSEEKRVLSDKMKELESFSANVSALVKLLNEAGRAVEKQDVLSALCERDVPAAEKETAVEQLRLAVVDLNNQLLMRLGQTKQAIDQLSGQISEQLAIAEACARHKEVYAQIPEYVGLKEEINREFARRKLDAEARFACEYVIGLRDEAWRDAIEAFLGPRRYTILVPPQHYDLADEILNRSQHRYAHLFNTKLLMRRKAEAAPDSAVHLLEIRNETAQQYFTYQLGRMHAVPLEEVRDYENAISKEGRVSVAMDGYFLRFDKLRAYYLGQETFELNRVRAEREAERLRGEKQQLLAEAEQLRMRSAVLADSRPFSRDYQYDAHEAYQRAAAQCLAAEQQLKDLKKAQAHNREFLELSQLAERLQKERETVKKEHGERADTESRLKTRILSNEDKIISRSQELSAEQEIWERFERDAYPQVQRALEAYQKYLRRESSLGGLLQPQSRERLRQQIDKSKNDLLKLQTTYLTRHADSALSIDMQKREAYASRRERIWMDNLQEIRQKLDDQTRRYEDIFKNEFVLSILKACEQARSDLRDINIELAKLNFSARYQFDVDYVKDGSDYARIIRYAKYLNEREKLGGGDGQGTLAIFTSFSDEEAAQLEQELKQIINRVIGQGSEEAIARLADYRNYMTYEILISNEILDRAKLSRQTGFNSGAEVQIPYLLILISALLMIYNSRINSTRLVFIDEPFVKMDPGNVRRMLDFMRAQNLQVIFCAPDKTETIGNVCEVILPVLRVSPDNMLLGVVQFHKGMHESMGNLEQ